MTRIEWVVRVADAIGGKAESWNPVVGCARSSDLCRNCYAQRLAGTRLKNTSRYRGLTTDSKRGPVWTGGVRCHDDLLQKPLGWNPQGSLQAPPMLDWVIGGGESGPKARPMHPDWARGLRDDCGRAGVPFFFKQWGEYGPPDRTFDAIDGPPITRIGDVDVAGIGRFGRKKTGRLLDLKIHEQIPETERTLA